LSALQVDRAPERAPKSDGAFFIPPTDLDQYWPSIDLIVKQAESWTQIISLSDIREQLLDHRMLAWGVRDRADQFGLAIARLHDSARGAICTAWVILPRSTKDNASISALLGEVETFARFRSAAVLELFVAPWSALKVQDLARAKITAAILEVDLRSSRRTN
jgi:hypothetical protein